MNLGDVRLRSQLWKCRQDVNMRIFKRGQCHCSQSSLLNILSKNNMLLFLIVVLFLSNSHQAMAAGEGAGSGERVYQASLTQSLWLAESSIYGCRVFQNLPAYGDLEFTHAAGESLRFQLKPYKNPMLPGAMTVTSKPAAWHSVGLVTQLAVSQVVAGAATIELNTALADRLMSELYEGRIPQLRAPARFNASQSVTVALSPVRFASAYREYQQCIQNLLPVNFAQIERSSIFWPEGSLELSASAKKLLDNIVTYSDADQSVTSFEVDGFTDTAGERLDNLRLSEQRAFAVTDYLVAQGIDPERIATRAHGEREEYLIVKNERSEADRNRNRRVNVVLRR